MFARRAIIRLTASAGLALGAHAHAQTPLGTGFTYQGRLEQNGSAANGTYDMEFALFDAAINGAQVGATICADQVLVEDGLFTLPLDFGAQFNGDSRWLRIGVRADTLSANCGTGVYTTLDPRQPMAAAPYALKVRGIDGHSLDAADGSPSDALYVDGAGLVGIGTTAPTQELDILQPSGSADIVVESGNHQAAITLLSDGGGPVWMFTPDASDDLRFGAGSLDRMTITAGGEVGIGITGPTSILHILGAEGTNKAHLALGRAAATSGQPSSTLALLGNNIQHAGLAWVPHADLATGKLNVTFGGFANPAGNTPRVTFQANGNVGIGTSNPQGRLDIEIGAGGANLQVFEDTGNVPALRSVQGGFPGALRLRAGVEFRPYNGLASNAGFTIWNEANTAMNSALVADGTSYLRGGPVAIGTTDAAGFLFAVNGTAGKPGGGSWSVFCDARLKTNVEPMRGTLDRLLLLRGYTFEYLPEAVEQRFALPGSQIGLIAQEVETVFPDWVSQDAAGYKYVTERSTTALMVEALRELRAEKDAQIKRLRDDNADLAARLDRLEQALADLALAAREQP